MYSRKIIAATPLILATAVRFCTNLPPRIPKQLTVVSARMHITLKTFSSTVFKARICPAYSPKATASAAMLPE